MKQNKIVWVNGCFDVLHRGHMELFRFAKKQGTYLIVGIDTDRRIKQSKGASRPFNSQEDRKFFLEGIKYIDEVVIFDNSVELCNLVMLKKPDVMVVGSDWKDKRVVGSQYANELIFFDRIGNYSTTSILEK